MDFIRQMLNVRFDLDQQTFGLLHFDSRVISSSLFFLQLIFFYFDCSLSSVYNKS